MNEDLITIIIPAYNAQKTISRTLEALQKQTYPNWEAMVVDNNSSDKTAEIIKDFATKDSRIKYFLQEIKGPAAARNKGLEKAQGEYVMFCDSDDWYESNMCEEMITLIKKHRVDLVTSQPNIIYEKGIRANTEGDIDYHALEKFGKFRMDKEHYWMNKDTLWNKIFKKSVIDEYQITFPIGSLFDDAFFILCYCLVVKSFYCSKKKLYNYIFSETGITYNIQHNKYSIDQLAMGFETGIKFLIKHNILDKEKLDICLTKTKDVLAYPISYIFNDNDLIHLFDTIRDTYHDIDRKLFFTTPALLFIVQGNYNLAAIHFGRFNKMRGNFILNKRFKKFGLIENIRLCGLPIIKKRFLSNKISYCLFGKLPIWTKCLKPASTKFKSPENMHIFFAANNAFAKPLGVAISSLFCHARPQDNINIYIINDNISLLNRILIKLSRRNKKQKIKFIQVDNSIFNDLPTMGYFKKQNYYRFLIPQLKPEISKALYLDCDIVVKQELNALWNTNIDKHYIAATPDFGALLEICQKDSKNQQKIIKFDGTYFNSGVMLINIKLWTQDKITKKLFKDAISIKDKILYADQCVLNYTLRKKVKYLDFTFNFQTHGEHIANKEFLKEYYIAKCSPTIIHYTCKAKPFLHVKKCEHPLWKEWFKELYKSPFSFKKWPINIDFYPQNSFAILLFNFCILKKTKRSYIHSACFLKKTTFSFLGIKIDIPPSRKKITNTIFYCLWNIKDEINQKITQQQQIRKEYHAKCHYK